MSLGLSGKNQGGFLKMAGQKYEIDMSRGSLLKNIIGFAVPLILTNVLQLLYNAADIVVVGRWVGSNALASVGSTASLNNLIISIFIGISLGAGVVVSQRFGAKDADGVKSAVHTVMFIGFVAGIVVLLVGEIFAGPMLRLMGTPEGEVMDGSLLYMRIWFVGAPALLVYNFGAAILRSIGDTKRPLMILAATGLINVLLNLFFVIVLKMGVEGVALPTSIANYLSMAAVLYTLTHSDGVYRLDLKKLRVHKKELVDVLKIGLPAGLQGSVFSLSNVTIQSAVNSFGAVVMAGSSAAANIEGFVYMAMNAFYQAAVTAVSQNYGAGNRERIRRSVFVSLACVTVAGAVLGGLSVLFGKTLLSIYITDSPEAIVYGYRRMVMTCLPYFMCGIMEVLCGYMRGLGYSAIPAVNSLVGACGFRIIWVFFVLPYNRTIDFLYMCWPLSWGVVILLHIICTFYVRKRAYEKMAVNC